MAAQAPGLVKALVTVPAGPVAFTGVRLFDADATRFLTDQTVVVDKGVITAVGARASVTVPAGAQVIDGRGKTLDPGPVGLPHARRRRLHRLAGVVDGRDVGARPRQRRRAHDRPPDAERPRARCCPRTSIHPRSSTARAPYTAQVANVATSEAEAIALVDKAKANGFTGIKFYGTFNPAWLPASIREAHKLGLHVHGHIPAGIRPVDAINAGYDEITHINWVMMQAMPDSVIPVSNGIMRFEGPGRYAKDVNLEGPAIKTIVGAMASKHIYSDPTMVAFESLYVPENGDLSPSYAPFVGTLPPTTERGFRTGGFAVPKDLTRADYRASWAKMVGLLGRMHKAGVPIVAGTDGAGIEIVHELEIYVQAGLSPAEALAAATIVPARLVGQDAKTGSVKVGKAADLALVDGDPSTRIGDLRQTRVVMLDGKLLDADALRRAAGFSGRPKQIPSQNPPAPAAITPRLDTPQARVIVATLQPRTPSIARNGHATNRVLIYLDDGVMTRTEGDQSTRIEFHRGDVRWRPASGAYTAENISDHPIRILEIDLKGPPAGPAPVSKLDPVTVDGKHYKVEFENEQVRVLRDPLRAAREGADARAHPEPRRPLPERPDQPRRQTTFAWPAPRHTRRRMPPINPPTESPSS